MPPSRPLLSLPPQFLLPSWTPHQLQHLVQHRTIHQKTRIRARGGLPPKPLGESLFGSRRIDLTPPIPAPTSLFEELFPEETQRIPTRTPSSPKHPRVPSRSKFPKLPTFDWTNNIEIFSEDELRRRALEKEKRDWEIVGKDRGKEAEDAQQRREASVLILQCASSTLEESDFFRLSPRGEHIEGWTSGIIKSVYSFYLFLEFHFKRRERELVHNNISNNFPSNPRPRPPNPQISRPLLHTLLLSRRSPCLLPPNH